MKKNDLISRNALVAKTEVLYQHTSSGKIIPWSAVRVCAINNTPTIDAVRVVRCRDCEYNEGIPMPIGFLYCSRTDSVVKEDDYCSYGWRA